MTGSRNVILNKELESFNYFLQENGCNNIFTK